MSTPSYKRRGKFIVLEGLDKAGKSTQCARLVSNLQSLGHQVHSLRFPDRSTAIGRLIDEYLRSESDRSKRANNENNKTAEGVEAPRLKSSPPSVPSDQAIHLLFSANRWEHATTIESTLVSGTSIVCDRYYYSGCVYSAAKGIPGLDLAWARAPDVGLPRPDLCLLLDVSADVAMKRAGRERSAAAEIRATEPAPNEVGGDSSTVHERYETPAMQARVRQLFDELRSGGEGSDKHVDEADDIVVVDASASLDEVEKEVLQRVLQAFENVDAGGDAGAGSVAPLRRVRAWQ